MKTKRILIAVGSSGGHIYPAMAMSEQISLKNKNSVVSLIYEDIPFAKKLIHSWSQPAYPLSFSALRGQGILKKIIRLFFFCHGLSSKLQGL